MKWGQVGQDRHGISTPLVGFNCFLSCLSVHPDGFGFQSFFLTPDPFLKIFRMYVYLNKMICKAKVSVKVKWGHMYKIFVCSILVCIQYLSNHWSNSESISHTCPS